jgi:hypothetical protein
MANSADAHARITMAVGDPILSVIGWPYNRSLGSFEPISNPAPKTSPALGDKFRTDHVIDRCSNSFGLVEYSKSSALRRMTPRATMNDSFRKRFKPPAACLSSALLILCLISTRVVSENSVPWRDIKTLFAAAQSDGRVGLARKSKPVDARPARPGEVIVTVILGEGVETRSRPATQGDWVVRNRCADTGNEEYLVSAKAFIERYEDLLGDPDAEGWRAVRPRGARCAIFLSARRVEVSNLMRLGES